MNTRTRLYIAIPVVILVGFLVWYFQAIVVYILIAAIVSFIGRPVMKIMSKVKIRNFQFPSALAAALTLGIIYLTIASLFTILIPAIGQQAESLSRLNVDQITDRLEQPLFQIQIFAERYQLYEQRDEIVNYVESQLTDFVESVDVTSFFNTVGGIIGNLFVAIFSISFISFFFLKESRLFHDIILTLTPSGSENRMDRILDTIKPLLTRYFIGVLIEVLLVGSLISLGLTVLGVKNALVIGFFSGFLNIIPYMGPLLGSILGLGLSLVGNVDLPLYPELVWLLIKVAIVYAIVQLADNLIFQPLIYSNSVKAHPLEIFLVILMAGSFAGIIGMVMAIPVYTILRVVAKEFLSEFKIVQSITRDI